MPTYGYICEGCGYEFEQFHNISLRLIECPKCHNQTLVRLVGEGSGIIFKGDGWTLPSKETRKVPDEVL